MAALLAAAVPCAAATSKAVPHRVVRTLAIDGSKAAVTPFSPPLLDSAHFTFTAPGRAASTARVDTVERAFRFTPSGQSSNRRGLSIGVTSKVVTASNDTRTAPVETFAVTPAAYNVGLAVGWRGFAVGGGFTRYEAPVTALGPNHREGVDASLSYHGRNWKTALQVAAETGSPLLLTPLERRYSVDLGGAYAVGPRLSLSGGVRYQLAPVSPSLLDTNRSDSSVYVGTAFSF